MKEIKPTVMQRKALLRIVKPMSLKRVTLKETFVRCYDCGAVKRGKINKPKTTLCPPHENEKD